MKIGLVAALIKDNDVDHQLSVIESYLKKNKDCELLCFGESFLQGFDALTWDYEIDKNIGLDLNSSVIGIVKDLAKKYRCALSFGFVEKYKEDLYCTNLVIDKDGNIVDVFRRVSEGWKVTKTTSQYKEGDGFHSFVLDGIKFSTAICGDLWYDENVDEMNRVNKDIILWPMYIDFSKKRWEISEEEQYIERSFKLGVPALMYNSYKEDPKGANGGCYVFKDGELVDSLEMGIEGVLEVDTDKLLHQN
ncbi:carbon-nitrogen hydrolase family protein [Tissierella creatinophila]|uniref:Carbon-nitrogen hydrolase n=1 Tax=Tissierella creatinophila DSM 6911 TaxID=1123403 RepID=A0A1U7M7H9_TISCR|nr:carbon-nitrogen hydrolase family protein [Tissierella creatinophila]OLS03235.1 carbon-nitrogen hydrolase [Tissierella creatinophila DSM 6911]